MARQKYEFQATSGAFGPGQSPRGWRGISRHATLSAARRALERDVEEMRLACGPNAWSHHQRIVAVVDVTLSAMHICVGPVIGERVDACANAATVVYVVGAGDPLPAPPLPPGWSPSICPTCRAVEIERE